MRIRRRYLSVAAAILAAVAVGVILALLVARQEPSATPEPDVAVPARESQPNAAGREEPRETADVVKTGPDEQDIAEEGEPTPATPLDAPAPETVPDAKDPVGDLRKAIMGGPYGKMPIDELYAVYAHKAGPDARVAGLALLIRKSESLPFLLEELGRGPEGQKIGALLFLQKVAAWQEASARVLHLVRSPETDPNLRVRALATAAVLGVGDARGDIARSLRGSSDETTREVAAFALGHLGKRNDLLGLERALSDGSPRVRIAAAEALGRLGDTSGLSVALQLSSAPDWAVRLRATEALGSIVCDQARLRLEAISTRDTSPGTRMAAVVALHQNRVATMSPEKRLDYLRQCLRTEREETTGWCMKYLFENHREQAAVILREHAPRSRPGELLILARYLWLLDESRI